MSDCYRDGVMEPSDTSSDGKIKWGKDSDGTSVIVNPQTARPTVAVRLHRHIDHFAPDALEVLVDQLIAARDQVRSIERFARDPETECRVASEAKIPTVS